MFMQRINGFSLSRTSDIEETSVEQVKDLVHKCSQSDHVSQGHLFSLAKAPAQKRALRTRMLRNAHVFFIATVVDS